MRGKVGEREESHGVPFSETNANYTLCSDEVKSFATDLRVTTYSHRGSSNINKQPNHNFCPGKYVYTTIINFFCPGKCVPVIKSFQDYLVTVPMMLPLVFTRHASSITNAIELCHRGSNWP